MSKNIPQPAAPAARQEAFFYGQVNGGFEPRQLYALDDQTVTLETAIKAETGLNDPFIETYAELVTYTLALMFNWREDVPDDFKRLEDWWRLKESGQSSGVCYLYCREHVPMQLIRDWRRAVSNSIKNWKPPEEKPKAELTPEELADPNFSSAGQP